MIVKSATDALGAFVLVLLLGSFPGSSLMCKTLTDISEICATETQVCTSFTFFDEPFQGCMESIAGDGTNSCELLKQLDADACCCAFDNCNESGKNCGRRKRMLQQTPTFAPTTYARIDGGFCAVPYSFNQEFTTPCDFGSTEGWTYTSPSLTLTNIQGCITVGEAEPLNGRELLSDSDFWCPYALEGDAEYDAAINGNWGSCECSSCRINPNANPSGIASSGLCEFGANGAWTYVSESGQETLNLTSCVTVGDFPPLGWTDMGVTAETLWCPSVLDLQDKYDLQDIELSQNWGVCECAGAVVAGTTKPSSSPSKSPSKTITKSPTMAPVGTVAPTPVYTANGQYCEIQGNTAAPIQTGKCNFGSNGEWDYIGVDTLRDEGLLGCVPISEFPPRQEGPARFIDENSLWCPGPIGLDNTNAYDLAVLPNSLSWGLCVCETCRVTAQSATIPFGGTAKSGLCNFGTDPDHLWGYLVDNAVVVNMTQCPLIADFPPFGANLTALDPETTRWCPSGASSLNNNNVYNPLDPETRANWGLCECLQTASPTVFIDTDEPTSSPSVSQPTRSPSTSIPSKTPTTSLPTKTPTKRPTTRAPTDSPFFDPETVVPSSSPLAFDTTCAITSVLNASVASPGSVCGFGSGTWQYQSSSASSGLMSGCVTIGAFPPLGSEGVDESLLWCPSFAGLNLGSIYNPDAVFPESEPMAWGFCACENCQITVINNSTGPIQSGACEFGPNREWKYQPLNSEALITVVGCASIDAPTRPLLPPSVVFPPGTTWCPSPGGLTSDYIYTFVGEFNDPSQWGLCSCEATIPPTPETRSPVPEPTKVGDTRKPSINPTVRPTTNFPTSDAPTFKPTRIPTLQPTSSSPTSKPTTQSPTSSPSCCTIVPGGPVSPNGGGVTCNFGKRGNWNYQAVRATNGLSGCVAIDDYVPFNSSSLRDQGLKWCPANDPSGLNDENTYAFFNPNTRSNWGLCDCPCIPTEVPRTKRPTMPPDQVDKLALFIQADHSGSIRMANKQCRQQTNGQMTCWNLLSSFVRNLIGNVTSTLGGPQNFRLFLSSFGCVNGNPRSKTLSDGLTMPGDEKQVNEALSRLAGLKESNMYGTCPSKGADRMITHMARLSGEWAIAYIIVTDGKVQPVDQNKFTTAIRGVKDRMRKRRGENICASTIGFSDTSEIKRLLRTNCIFPASGFVEIASRPYSSRVASGLLRSNDIPEVIVGGPPTFPFIPGPGTDSNPDDDGTVPENPPVHPEGQSNQQQDSQGTLVLGAAVGVIGLFVTGGVLLVASRRRSNRRHVPKPHRHPDEIYWIENPARPESPPPSNDAPVGGGVNAQPRRRSRASSDIGFINLPPPPPMPTDLPTSSPPPPPSPTKFDDIGVTIGSPHPYLRRSPSPPNSAVRIAQSSSFIEIDPKELPPPPALPASGMFVRKNRAGDESLEEEELDRLRKTSSSTTSPDRMDRLKKQLSPFSSSPQSKRRATPASPLGPYQPGFEDSKQSSQSPVSTVAASSRFESFKPVALSTNKPISPQKVARPAPQFEVGDSAKAAKIPSSQGGGEVVSSAFRSLDKSFEGETESFTSFRPLGTKKDSF